MRTRAQLAALLAGRRVLRRTNPELEMWSREQWQSWLEGQGKGLGDTSREPIVVVAALSSLDDIPIHVGLIQLLCDPALRCAVVLSMGSEESARLAQAQARRAGWEGLVRIVDDDEAERLIRALPENMVLALFPTPTHLAEGVALPIASGEISDPSLAERFIGPAGRYGEWQQAADPAFANQAATSLQRLVALDSTTLPRCAPIAGAPLQHTAPAEAELDLKEDRAELPHLGPTDELRLFAPSLDGRGPLVLRRIGALRDVGGSLTIRMPVQYVTTRPSKARLEVRSGDRLPAATEFPFHVPPSRLKPWMLTACLNRGGAGNPVIRSFAHGTGCRIAYAESEPENLRDIPVVWGVLRGSGEILARAQASDRYFFYIDHAYFNRGHGKTYRITRNGFEAGAVRECPGFRFRSLGREIFPWRSGGREIIVCPPTEFFMEAHGCPDWTENTLAALEQVTDRPIVLREKPKPGEAAVPLAKALETAHALVTHSSNVAIEAACFGTPVFVSPTSAAAPVGCTDLSSIETPVYPDRDPWLAHLAYNQFSLEEIESGNAWRMLLELEERPFV